MSVTYADFQGPYRSLSQAREELESAGRYLDKVNALCDYMHRYDWYLNLCQAQQELNEAHESVLSQFGEEVYKKIVTKKV